MCCVKLVYSEAILVNFPNSVKFRIPPGWCQVPFGIYLYCLGGEAIVFKNLGVVKLPVIVVTLMSFTLKGSSKQSRNLVIKWLLAHPMQYQLNNGIR